jgi:CubicO group peptidase (beta-lactamase class C family)
VGEPAEPDARYPIRVRTEGAGPGTSPRSPVRAGASVRRVPALEEELDAVAAGSGFSGVVRVDRGDQVELVKAYGFAHRGYELPNEIDTRFALASGTKGLTALAVVSLVEEGLLELTTKARSLLRDDLPLIRDNVTVELLLAHRSGIGDYLDEDSDVDVSKYLMPVPVYELATTEDYLAVLDGHPPKFAPGERFSYCNSGYVVLALVAERASGVPFHDLVRERVCEPAGMRDTAFLRSDELPARTALGYLEVDGVRRTNVFHLPVRGSGDGGIYSTVADVRSLWAAFFAGRIVSAKWVDEMVRPRSEVPANSMRYGLGFWLHASTDAVILEGMDAGVSFRSTHDPRALRTYTVVSNTTDGAWPVVRFLIERLDS